MRDLKGKVAVVTGGASGIGFAISRALAEEGCNLVIADRRASAAHEAVEKLSGGDVRVLGLECDVTKAEQVEQLREVSWQEFGRVDLVFCNAGVMAAPAPFLETPMKVARWMFEVNVFGTFNTVQAFAKRFVDQGSPAHIVITGSENSICVPVPMMLSYNASKHALLGLAEMLRMEMPDFIKVSILCPGMVKTGLSSSATDRAAEFGGPETDPFGGELPFGMEAEEIGKHTIEQIKRGAFYIVTHHSNRYMVEERYRQLLAAFDEQAPAFQGWEAFDTRRVVAQVMASEQVQSGGQ